MRETHRSDILFALFAVLLAYIAFRVRTVLMLVYLSALFAVVLAPAIDVVRRVRIGSWRPGRGLSILLLILFVAGLLTLFFVFFVPPIYRDAQALAENWPQKMADLTARIRTLPLMGNFSLGGLQTFTNRLAGTAFDLFRNVAGGVLGVFTWIIITSYFILDGERAFYWTLSMFPQAQRDRLERTMVRAEQRMRHWLLGQLILMMALGTTSLLVFGLMDLKYYYALAVFTGIANIIPIVGPLTAGTVVCVVALVDSPAKFLGVLAFFLIYQQVETALLTPRVMKSTVNLPPLAVIIALSLGGALAGVIGAMVAVPTAALCAVLIDEYLVKKDAKVAPVG